MVDRVKTHNKGIQDIQSKYGSICEAIKKSNVLLVLDFVINILIDSFSKKCYKPKNSNYGILDAVFQRSIDQFERYASVANEIKKVKQKQLSVLDVGAGSKGISLFSGLFAEKNCDILLLDIGRQFLASKEQTAIGDGCNLPFRNGAFDIVVSVDVIEHVPKYLRGNLYKELKRVCKKKLIITCPLQSDDGIFQGRTYDIIFQSLYERTYGTKEQNTEQHIVSNHPTLKEVNTELPGAIIYGYKNCETWLKYMLFSSKPLMRFFSGLLYYSFLKRNNYEPPFWGAIIILDLCETFD